MNNEEFKKLFSAKLDSMSDEQFQQTLQEIGCRDYHQAIAEDYEAVKNMLKEASRHALTVECVLSFAESFSTNQSVLHAVAEARREWDI